MILAFCKCLTASWIKFCKILLIANNSAEIWGRNENDMESIRIFISSVQAEFSVQRRRLCDYIRQDALLGKFFVPFIFEELPASDVSASQAYLREAGSCDVYLCLLGEQYGNEDAEGVSPTEREYDEATKCFRYRLAFVKRSDCRQEKEQIFVRKVEKDVVRRSFADFEELRSGVYASLIRYLETKEIIHRFPFDATAHPSAGLDCLDVEKMRLFVERARKKRKYALTFEAGAEAVLRSMNLLTDDGRLTNSALLLFAKDPQAFFLPSEVKCAQFYGTKVQKPAPFYQVFHGNVFELVDQAKSFVMSHIDARVGDHSTDDNVDYELPESAVHEALVNAVIHRDYTRNASVQVMLFKDRLEVWSPGQLPYGLTPSKLATKHSSEPVNPILAHPAYLAGYIERLGTGTTDMIDACVAKGLKAPEFVQDEDFCTVIWRKASASAPAGVADKENDKEKSLKLTVNQSVVFFFIKSVDKENDKEKLTTAYIAERVRLSYPTVQRIIKFLVENGLVCRVGGDKGGYWKVSSR